MAAAKSEADYVLGTHDEEIARLGLQHRVWRPVVTECWQRIGITHGWRVIDIGAGPGYATADLAEMVGPTGAVLAVERSTRFLEAARERCRRRGVSNVDFREADLMDYSLGELNFDAAWCRWVASFVSSPEKLIANIAGALRPGGLAIFHEYSDYETFCFMPAKPNLQRFIQEVMASWRAAGGEPNIARQLPELLRAAGLRALEINPRLRCVSQRDYTWQWPKSFIEINVRRLQELGRISDELAGDILREFREAEADPNSWFTTPLFLEIVARKEPS
ncbi:MAG: methyltransferase domain-containing protein [Chthoniobacterales bacterium]